MDRKEIGTWIDKFRSLSFGGLLVGGVAGVIYTWQPKWFQGADLRTVLLLGSMLGAALHNFINSIFSPPMHYASFYFRFLNLLYLRRYLSEEKTQELQEQLIVNLILGEERTAQTDKGSGTKKNAKKQKIKEDTHKHDEEVKGKEPLMLPDIESTDHAVPDLASKKTKVPQ